MPQTTVNDTQSVALFEGALADSSRPECESRVNEEASAEIPFGVMVAEGSADKQKGALNLSAQADKLAGVVTHSHAYNKDNELGATGLKPDVVMTVLRRGVVWVKVEESVTPDSPVRVRAVATGSEVPGAFRTSQDLTDTIDISSFARYLGSASAGGLVKLWIDMLDRADAVLDT